MLSRYLFKLPTSALARSPFSTTVTRDRINYYAILQVESSATQQAIRKAYAELTQGLRPEYDSIKFNKLNQAFVILIDNKTRDAYDSLLSVRKSSYLSQEEQTIPATRSYLSERRSNALQDLKKKMNIDEFGRYKGGLPNRKNSLRGKSREEAGTMHRPRDIEEELDRFPEFNVVTAEKAESYKNFHQDEREARTMKWPWFTFEVDYHFFTLRYFRKQIWPKLQLLILFFYIIPTLYYAYDTFEKKEFVQEIKTKAAKKAHDAQTAKLAASQVVPPSAQHETA